MPGGSLGLPQTTVRVSGPGRDAARQPKASPAIRRPRPNHHRHPAGPPRCHHRPDAIVAGKVPAGPVSFNDSDECTLGSRPSISARSQALDDVIGQVPEFVFAIVLQIFSCDGVVEKLARDLVPGPSGSRADLMRLRYSALVFPLPRKAFYPSLVPSRHTGFLSTASTETASFVGAEPATQSA